MHGFRTNEEMGEGNNQLKVQRMTVKTDICQTECDVKVTCVLCRSAVSRQHIAPHRLHLHQLLTDDTADLDSYEVSASVLACRF